jgi:hypothetical protein
MINFNFRRKLRGKQLKSTMHLKYDLLWKTMKFINK